MTASRTALEPRRRPRQSRSRETVAALLDAAAQVFERHGYAAGTTNRIAERAGVSIGTLYQYFPNKQAILVALTAAHLDEGAALLAPLAARLAADPPPVAEGLDALVGTMVALHARTPQLHRVLFEECPRPPALEARIAAIHAQAVAVVAAWLAARPEATVPDARLAAELVVQTVEGVTHRLVIRPAPGRSDDDYAAETVRMLTRYLCGA